MGSPGSRAIYYEIVGETWPTLHVCRHTFATHMIEATEGNLLAVADWMGHDPDVLRDRYRHKLAKFDALLVAKADAYAASSR